MSAAPLTQHWRSLFENKYLGAWNLWDAAKGSYRTTTVTIAQVTQERVTMQGGRQESALLCYFQGKRTPMILSKKMGRVIATMYGPVPAGWAGKAITLYVERGFKTKDGPADVLRVKNERAGDAMKAAMRGGPELDEAPLPEPEMFDDAGSDDPDKGP